jgi:NTP-dependent ternary system trypsin peptidase co-occuring protein
MAIVGTTTEVAGQRTVILVEVDSAPEVGGGWGEDVQTRETRATRVMDAARDVFGDGLALARDCAVRTVDVLDKTPDDLKPTEFELQLSIGLDAEAGAVITKVGANAQMQVTMRWKRPSGG